MNTLQSISQALIVLIALSLNGCASQSQIRSIRADLDDIRQLVEKANSDAQEAIQKATLVLQDSAQAQKSAQSASEDAKATRIMIEQMNSRMDELQMKPTLK